MICHQPVSFQHVLLLFRKAFLGQLTYWKTIELAQHLSSGLFLSSWSRNSWHINNETKIREVFTTYVLHTRTLSLFGGSTSRSFLNQVSLSLWSFANLIYVILSFVGYTIHHCKKGFTLKTFPMCVRWNHCVPLARHIAYQSSCWTRDVIDMCVAKCMCTAVTWYTVLNIIHCLGCKVNMDNQHIMDLSYIIWILL